MILYDGNYKKGRITNIHSFYTRMFRKEPIAGANNVVFELAKGQFVDGEVGEYPIITDNYAWYAFKKKEQVLYVPAYHVDRPNASYIRIDYFEQEPEYANLIEYLHIYDILSRGIARDELRAIAKLFRNLSYLSYYPEIITTFFLNISKEIEKYLE